MIRISRDHPIRLQTGRQYPRELLRGAFREMRAACRAQPDVPRLGDVAVDAGEPLFTLAYEQNRIQQHGFQAVTAAGYWSYDFLQTPLDRLDLTLLRRYRVFVFCELEEYTLAILELLLRMRGIQHGGRMCVCTARIRWCARSLHLERCSSWSKKTSWPGQPASRGIIRMSA